MTKDGNYDSLLVRAATSADASAMSLLLIEAEYPASTEIVAQRLEAMSDTDDVVMIAVRNNEKLGLLTVHFDTVLHRAEPVGRITLLVVAERARGQGIGRALMEAAAREFVTRSCTDVEVISNLRYQGAHAFYQHLGYEMTSYKFKKTLPSPNLPEASVASKPLLT